MPGENRRHALPIEIVKRIALRLKVVDQMHLGGPGGAGNLGPVDDPIEIGQLRPARPHRPCHPGAERIWPRALLGEILNQHR